MIAVGRQVTLEWKAVHLAGVTSVFGWGEGKEEEPFLWSCNPAGSSKETSLQAAFKLCSSASCICCSFCLSELPSHETSSVPLQL